MPFTIAIYGLRDWQRHNKHLQKGHEECGVLIFLILCKQQQIHNWESEMTRHGVTGDIMQKGPLFTPQKSDLQYRGLSGHGLLMSQ